MRWKKASSREASAWYLCHSCCNEGNRLSGVIVPQIKLTRGWRGRFLHIDGEQITLTKAQFHHHHQHPNELYMEIML